MSMNNMLRRLAIGPRLALAMGLTMSVFIVTLGGLWLTLDDHVEDSEQIRQQELPLMVTAEHMVLDLVQVQHYLSVVAATRNREAFTYAEAYAAHFREGLREFKNHFEKAKDADGLEKIAHMTMNFERHYGLGREMAETYVVKGAGSGNKLMQSFDRDWLDMQADVDLFEVGFQQRMFDETREVVESGKQMQSMLLLSGLVGLFVGSLISWLSVRSITRPISHAVEIAESIAAGNLSLPVRSSGRDETGQLLDSMARMQANLRQLLSNAQLDAEALTLATSNAWQSALQTLRQTTAELEDLYQNAPCGYHSLDAEGRFVRINDTELNWLGYSREEVVGQPMAKFLTPDSRKAHFRHFSRLHSAIHHQDIELEFVCRDGLSLPVLLSESASFDDDGGVVVSRASVFDLTGHRHLELERAERARHIEALSRRLISVQEQERYRLSKELHDRTGANLATLNTYLKIISTRLPQPLSPEVTGFFADSRVVLEDMTRSVREICADLRPSMLDYAGLVPALESYAKQFEKRNGIEVQMQTHAQKISLPQEVESNLFRIVQEALTNSSKHAQCSIVSIHIHDDAGSIRLIISDDGVGFDPGALLDGENDPGLGLITMRERCEFIGGQFALHSQPGQGTRIEVVLPAPPAYTLASDAPAAGSEV